jgi:hypothetical protein
MASHIKEEYEDVPATLPEGQDHLSMLPPELLSEICAYLFPNHDLKRKYPDSYWRSDAGPPCSQPLDLYVEESISMRERDDQTLIHHSSLAATSRHIRAAVSSWARSFLLQHTTGDGDKHNDNRKAGEIPIPLSMNPDSNSLKKSGISTYLRGRRSLLTWSETHCAFCGGSTWRHDTFVNSLCCCLNCDRTVWPNKVTKTAAKREYGLKDTDLFVDGKVAAPGLRMGKDRPRGRAATVFLRSDLQALSDRIRGVGWEADRASKAARRKANRQQREAKQEQRMQIEKEMRQRRGRLWWWQPWDWEDIIEQTVELILRDAPVGWYDLAPRVKKELLQDLPANWFEMTREERKEAAIALNQAGRKKEQDEKFREFEFQDQAKEGRSFSSAMNRLGGSR